MVFEIHYHAFIWKYNAYLSTSNDVAKAFYLRNVFKVNA